MGRGLSSRRRSKTPTAKRRRSLSILHDKFQSGAPLVDRDDEGEEADEDTISIQTEKEEESIGDAEVLTKYKTAAKFTNGALTAVIQMCISSASVRALCAAGDDYVRSKLATVYLKTVDTDGKPIAKGLAFPTNVSINEVVCNYTGMNDDIVLKDGDVVKIHLGCHIDGFPAIAAHTVLVGSDASEEVTNVLRATHVAMSSVVRMLHPGETNDAMTDTIQFVADHFHVQTVEGVLSHRVKRFVMDGQKCIITRRIVDQDPQQDVVSFAVDTDQVYNIDIVLSSKYPQLRPSDKHDATMFRRNEVLAPLRMKAARQALMEVRKRFWSFPFVVGDIFPTDVSRSRFAVKSLASSGLLDPMPVLASKGASVTARYSCTVAVTEKGIDVLCGQLPLGGNVSLDDVHFDAEIQALLTRSLQHSSKANRTATD